MGAMVDWVKTNFSCCCVESRRAEKKNEYFFGVRFRKANYDYDPPPRLQACPNDRRRVKEFRGAIE